MSTIVPQYKFSSRAGRVLFGAMQDFFAKRSPEIVRSRVTLDEIIGVQMSALAGTCAIGIRQGMMSRDDAIMGVSARFAEMVDRDLKAAGIVSSSQRS